MTSIDKYRTLGGTDDGYRNLWRVIWLDSAGVATGTTYHASEAQADAYIARHPRDLMHGATKTPTLVCTRQPITP
jgi:hypothetical protein